MIITLSEIKEIIKLDIDVKIYLELKTYYHPLTPALIMEDLRVNWDFHRTFKPTLDKLIVENPLVKITSLGTGEPLKKVTVNTPMRLEFKIENGTPGEESWITFNKDRSEQIRLRKAKLTNFELLIYLTIGTFRDKDTLSAFPSQVLLSEILETHHSSISRGIEGLISKGVLRKYTKHFLDGSGRASRQNFYYFDVSVLGVDTSTGEIIESIESEEYENGEQGISW